MATTPATSTPVTPASTPASVTAAADTSTKKDPAAAQAKVDDLKKQLADAEKELASTGATRATTAEDDAAATKKANEGAGAQPIHVVGRPGGPFTIDGKDFGASSGQPPWPGQVLIGGRVVTITSWRDNSIKGTLPPDLPATGDVEVTTAGGSKLTGKWPDRPAGGGRQVSVQTPDGRVVMGTLVPDGPTAPGAGAGAAGAGASPTAVVGGVEQGTGTTDRNPPPGSTGTTAGQNVGSGASTPVTTPK